jgi:hypothetical protein
MPSRMNLGLAALLGAAAALILLVGLVMAVPSQQPAMPPKPTFVTLPTPTPTPLPIVTPTPTTGPVGDTPEPTIAPFGDG